ncbi:MAG: helix-turn-helix domain-containing protein [Beijerinckiaceae bacterium]
MEIRPIITDEDHARALAAVEALWDAPEGSVESYELDALATLIDAYERKRWPVSASDPIEILEYAIRELGRSQVGLGEIIGSRARASEILSRKRALTIAMIDKVSTAWGIPRALLAVPYRLAKDAA